MNLRNLFLDQCAEKKSEVNENQLNVIKKLQDFHKKNF